MRSVCADCGTSMSTKGGVIVDGEYGSYKRLCDACVTVEMATRTSEVADD